MKKIIISTIVITALSTFWITKSILNSNGDHHHNEHAEHHGNDYCTYYNFLHSIISPDKLCSK